MQHQGSLQSSKMGVTWQWLPVETEPLTTASHPELGLVNRSVVETERYKSERSMTSAAR